MGFNLTKEGPVQVRRAWQAPAMTELPIRTETRAAEAKALEPGSGPGANPPPSAAPTTKLGFAFEMSFPLSVRTE